MRKRLPIVFTLLFCAQSWALSCSNPETLSDPRFNAAHVHAFSNKKGDVALTWLSEQGRNERFEVSYKMQNSPWSSPESLTNWERVIYSNSCFVNAEGDLFATWETEEEDKFLLHIAEKIQGKPWNYHLNWISDPKFVVSDTAFDTEGNLTFIGNKEVPYTPKPTSKYSYRTTTPAVVILTKSPSQIEQKSDIVQLEEGPYIGQTKIAINENGVGYAFWVSYALDERLLMCQKIADNHFIAEPEIACSLQGSSYGIETALNEKGDVAIAYYSEKGGNIIIKTEDSWPKPFLFADEKEEPRDFKVAIDRSGNAMAIWEAEIDATGVIKAIYKPVNQPWQSPTLFSSEDAVSWNPGLQLDGKGNFVAIWKQEKRSRNAIFGGVFSTTTQTWSDPQRLSPEDASCFGYDFTFWAPGKGYIAWTMSPNGFDDFIQVAELSN